LTQLEILAVLLVTIAVAHWLGTRPVGRLVGGALMVIILAAALANLGVIPLASEQVPVYDQLLGTAAPVSIFLLLLRVDLRTLARAGVPMLILFFLAAAGTIIGVLVAGWLLNARVWMGEWHGPLSGMFAATYIGGGANFNALALHYEVMQSGNLYAAATVADNVLTVLWISLLLALPKWIGWFLPESRPPVAAEAADLPAAAHDDAKPSLHDLVMLLALGLAAFVLSGRIAAWLASVAGIAIPPILILTTLALVLAHLDPIARLRGGEILGMFGAYLFLAALATYCEVAALQQTGWLGIRLLMFVLILVAVHGVLTIMAGKVMRLSAEVVAIVSATNIGGATVVLPLVERFKRPDLLLPGIVLGSLGNLLGTYIGFALVYLLRR
jgi:uncharacterized membrane protein